MTNFPIKSFNISFINLIKVLGAFDKPNGMTSHSCNPSFFLNLVFNSILENYLAPFTKSSKSSILGNGNLYLIVILLMALESLHILQVPSFFGIKNISTKHGLRIYMISPLSNNSFTWFLISPLS